MAEIEEAAPPEPDEMKKQQAPPPVPWVAAVAERYERGEKLGEGMFGEVYKALDRVSGRLVAVKRLSGSTDDGRFVRTPLEYFQQEVTSLTACLGSCPSVVQLLDTYADDSRADGDRYIITEYAGPMNLREYMHLRRRKGEPLDEDEVRDAMAQLLAGARDVHRAGVLHRDMVPENVVVDFGDASGRMVYKICGFGMSKPAAQPDMDGTGVVATSRLYRAPELMLGCTHKQEYDDRVDTWSVGCIMADLIAGDTESYSEWERLHERAVPQAKVALMMQKAGRQGLFPVAPQQLLLLSAAGFKVLKSLLDSNPDRRLSAADALSKRWFWFHRRR